MLRVLLYMIRWMIAMSFIVSVSGQAQTATYLHLSDVHLDLTGESRDTDPQALVYHQNQAEIDS